MWKRAFLNPSLAKGAFIECTIAKKTSGIPFFFFFFPSSFLSFVHLFIEFILFRYAYKIVVGDADSSELNHLLTMQDSMYVIKVINSEVVEEDNTIHLVCFYCLIVYFDCLLIIGKITELGEVNMEDYILDNWDKWTHNKIRSIAEEILFAIRDIHLV